MLEWVDTVGVGADAPGPQSGFELTPLQQAPLRVAAEEITRVCLGRAHLGAQLSPLGDQLIAHGAAQRAAKRAHQVKTQTMPVLAADTVWSGNLAVAVEQF